MQKYGGINTAQPIDQITEAVAYAKPPVVYTKLQLVFVYFATLVGGIIKLLPITLLLMAIMWGVSFLIVGAN